MTKQCTTKQAPLVLVHFATYFSFVAYCFTLGTALVWITSLLMAFNQENMEVESRALDQYSNTCNCDNHPSVPIAKIDCGFNGGGSNQFWLWMR